MPECMDGILLYTLCMSPKNLYFTSSLLCGPIRWSVRPFTIASGSNPAGSCSEGVPVLGHVVLVVEVADELLEDPDVLLVQVDGQQVVHGCGV